VKLLAYLRVSTIEQADKGYGLDVQREAIRKEALAELTVTEAEARLVLDWAQPYHHPALYKAIFRPAVLRANRLATAGDATLPTALKFSCTAAYLREPERGSRD
jgi:hypothetical protein